jgi:hypothetical protein
MSRLALFQKKKKKKKKGRVIVLLNPLAILLRL